MAAKSYLLFLVLLAVSVFASAHRPLVEKHEASEHSVPQKMEPVESKKKSDDMWNRVVRTDEGEKFDNMGNMMVETDSPSVIEPDSLAIGLYTIPFPGADGGFHIQFGPIGFGFSVGGGLQWGSPYPGGQPYVVISPYAPPYAPPIQYPYGPPNQQPVPTYDPPNYGSYEPIPSQGNPYGSPNQQPVPTYNPPPFGSYELIPPQETIHRVN